MWQLWLVILKHVQDDERGVGMTSRAGPSSCLCGFVRDTLAQLLAFAGRRVCALWVRAHPYPSRRREGKLSSQAGGDLGAVSALPTPTQWSLSDQSGGLIPPLACGRGICGVA